MDMMNNDMPTMHVHIILRKHLSVSIGITVSLTFFCFLLYVATAFLELWKRRQAILQWEWDLGMEDDDADEIRPEFETGVKTTRYVNERDLLSPVLKTTEEE